MENNEIAGIALLAVMCLLFITMSLSIFIPWRAWAYNKYLSDPDKYKQFPQRVKLALVFIVPYTMLLPLFCGLYFVLVTAYGLLYRVYGG